jgi:hypothetical protein
VVPQRIPCIRSLAAAAARVLAVADSSSFEVITHMSMRVNRMAWSQAVLVIVSSCPMLINQSLGQHVRCVCFAELITVLIFHVRVSDVVIATMVIAPPFAVFVKGVILRKQVAVSAVEHILLPRIECRLRLSISCRAVTITLYVQQ